MSGPSAKKSKVALLKGFQSVPFVAEEFQSFVPRSLLVFGRQRRIRRGHRGLKRRVPSALVAAFAWRRLRGVAKRCSRAGEDLESKRSARPVASIRRGHHSNGVLYLLRVACGCGVRVGGWAPDKTTGSNKTSTLPGLSVQEKVR